jgi:NAD(P)H-hydrate epimerase
MHSLQLMENAGRGVADVLCRLGAKGPLTVCCGWGNNGGDGLVIARHLELRGVEVRTLLFMPPGRIGPQDHGGPPAGSEMSAEELPDAQSLGLGPDVATNYTILRASGAALRVLSRAEEAAEWLAGCDWIVDALLGTGAHGEPRDPLRGAIDRMNAAGAPIMAVDLPSGLDADTGQAASHAIRAAHTCTFVAPKPGMLSPQAAGLVGTISVLDIGAPRWLVEEILRQARAEEASDG